MYNPFNHCDDYTGSYVFSLNFNFVGCCVFFEDLAALYKKTLIVIFIWNKLQHSVQIQPADFEKSLFVCSNGNSISKTGVIEKGKEPKPSI